MIRSRPVNPSTRGRDAHPSGAALCATAASSESDLRSLPSSSSSPPEGRLIVDLSEKPPPWGRSHEGLSRRLHCNALGRALRPTRDPAAIRDSQPQRGWGLPPRVPTPRPTQNRIRHESLSETNLGRREQVVFSARLCRNQQESEGSTQRQKVRDRALNTNVDSERGND